MYTSLVLLASVWLVVTQGSTVEILNNPGFESGVSGWSHDGFTMETAADQVHQGVASIKCTGRTKAYQGPAQVLQIYQGKTYVFRAWVKIINDISGHMYQTAYVKIRFRMKDGSTAYFPVCQRTFFSSSDGWSLLGGVFIAPNQDWTDARLNMAGLLPHTDYYFDDASLTEQIDNANWQQEADARIESLRKGDIKVNVNLDPKFDPKDVTVQINHLKHSFGWGSVVRSDLMTDPDFIQYQQVVYNMFNWATIQDYKWRYNRGNRTNPDYSTAIAATDVLNSHGINVRGHCMFWAVNDHSPDWVSGLSHQDVKSAVEDRIAFITAATKGKLQHWDVNNELVHGHFFEQHTGDPRYTEHMFKGVRQADSKPILFLNDYNVVANGEATQSYLSQIQKIKAANVGLGAVGVQSHYHDFDEPDATVVKSRLDLLASAGLPIWITELDLKAHDDATSADWLERVLRVYFSHPSVEGVILWGFWNHDMRDPNKALVEGYSFTLKEQGQRYMKLVKDTWSTHVNTSLASGTNFNIRGFKGDYEAVVWYQGKPIKRQTFALNSGSATVNVVVTGDGHAITIPIVPDPFNHLSPSHPETTNLHLHTLGTATSTASTTQLQCTNRFSHQSAVGDDARVEVRCSGDEVLTGCSSQSPNGDWHRNGEQIRIAQGKTTCRAGNGYRSTGSVRAAARCCAMKSLKCSYRTAGPSGTGVDDKVEVPCMAGTYALGCSTWSYHSHSDGSLFSNTSCAAENDDPSSGVFSYAACCQGDNLQCVTVTSGSSGLVLGDKASVECPLGYVMTGCNVFSQHGRAGGAFIGSHLQKDTCYGINGSDKHGLETGVKAQATCCKV